MGSEISIDRRGLGLLAGVVLLPAADIVTGRPEFTDQARGILDGLYAGYGQRDLATTARVAGAHLRTLSDLDGRRLNERTTQRVLGLQARAGALRARAFVDAGNTRAAWRTLGPTVGRAMRSGDRDVVAYGFATMSAGDLADGRPDEAIKMVGRGLQLAGDDARLYLASARAHAARGDAEDAEADVHIAERLVDEADAPMVAGPIPGVVSRLEWSRAAVDVYSRTGNGARAREVLEATVAAVPAELTEDTRQSLGASYALVQARTDPDAGADILRRTLAASAAMGRPSRAVTTRINAFLGAVPDPRHPAARDLAELHRSMVV